MGLFNKDRKPMPTTRIIMIGFLVTIAIGTVLLTLPCMAADGKMTEPIDALFTATTSVCVTGLVTVSTCSHWSILGQGVILLLVQIGGLGVVTFTTLILIIMRKRISLSDRVLIQDAYNLDSVHGVVKLTIKILKGTFLVEGIAAVLYSFVFIPEFGVLPGIWKSIFNAVSAFCNAGMDILGETSLQKYQGNVLVNFVTMALIILGGIGFPVWWNIIDLHKTRKEKYSSWKEAAHHLTLHTKIVLSMTAILFLAGTIIVLAFEYNNPETLGKMPWYEKVMAAMFQSVTLRTAGFFTVPQECLRSATAFAGMLFMVIGGSPSGTAGGVKTTTIAILVLAVISIVKGRKNTEVFSRKISTVLVKKALSVLALSTSVMFLGVIFMCLTTQADFLDILYETISAIGTVGLSRALTANLNVYGKTVIIVLMYAGRVGPISLALFFNSKKHVSTTSYPVENIGVG